jgi:hypothetical protein
MTTEIKPARRRVTFSGVITRPCTCHPADNPPIPCQEQYAFEECMKMAKKRVTPSFAKWEPPAKFLRQSPPEHRGIPFAEDKDYIKMDTFDKAVAIALAFGAGVWLFVTAYELGWL